MLIMLTGSSHIKGVHISGLLSGAICYTVQGTATLARNGHKPAEFRSVVLMNSLEATSVGRTMQFSSSK